MFFPVSEAWKWTQNHHKTSILMKKVTHAQGKKNQEVRKGAEWKTSVSHCPSPGSFSGGRPLHPKNKHILYFRTNQIVLSTPLSSLFSLSEGASLIITRGPPHFSHSPLTSCFMCTRYFCLNSPLSISWYFFTGISLSSANHPAANILFYVPGGPGRHICGINALPWTPI